MKILIATGLYPPDIGGPAQYAKHLHDEFVRQGHEVQVASFRQERNMPAGLRHIFYFMRILPFVRWADVVFAMDTFSVGMPAVLATKIYRKKIIIRVGGDFLWESYVEKYREKIALSEFNRRMPHLAGKEKIIYRLTRFTLQHAFALAFNSEWQKKLFSDSYKLNPERLFVVENFYGGKEQGNAPESKTFLWAGRDIFLKNVDELRHAFSQIKKKNPGISLEIITDMKYEDVLKKIKNCYAVILPSLSDVNPNFIIDAVRFGKPFIMTKETGLHERLYGIGIFIDPRDEKMLVEKILFLADDNNYTEYQKKVEQFNYTHSWEEIANEFLQSVGK